MKYFYNTPDSLPRQGENTKTRSQVAVAFYTCKSGVIADSEMFAVQGAVSTPLSLNTFHMTCR